MRSSVVSLLPVPPRPRPAASSALQRHAKRVIALTASLWGLRAPGVRRLTH